MLGRKGAGKKYDPCDELPEEDPELYGEKEIQASYLLEELKAKRKFRFLGRRLSVFIIFFVNYLVILTLQRDIHENYLLRKAVEQEIATSPTAAGMTFPGIRTIVDFWDWLENALLPEVYLQKWYNGEPLEERLSHTIAFQTKVIGGFRIRQKRRKINVGPRCYKNSMDNVSTPCQSSVESEEPFHRNLSLVTPSSYYPLTMFNFSDDDNGVGGYYQTFKYSVTKGVDERRILQNMKKLRWIDEFTKEVVIDLALYNNNLKSWVSVELALLFNLAGKITNVYHVRVLKVEPYNFNMTSNIGRLVLEALYAILVVYFIFVEIWEICVICNGQIFKYFNRYGVWSKVADLFNVMINGAIIVHWIEYIYDPTRIKLQSQSQLDKFVDLKLLGEWEDRFMTFNTVNVLFLTVRSLKYYQITNGGSRLIKSLFLAAPEIISFMPIYLTVVFGYTFAGHFLYGLHHKEWSTWGGSLFRVYEMNFGLYDTNIIYDTGGMVSSLYIYSATVAICIIMLNIFLAIIMTTWDALAEETKLLKEREGMGVLPLTSKSAIHLILLNETVLDDVIEVADEFKGTIKEQEFKEKCNLLSCLQEDQIAFVASLFWVKKFDNAMAKVLTTKIVPGIIHGFEKTKENAKHMKTCIDENSTGLLNNAGIQAENKDVVVDDSKLEGGSMDIPNCTNESKRACDNAQKQKSIEMVDLY